MSPCSCPGESCSICQCKICVCRNEDSESSLDEDSDMESTVMLNSEYEGKSDWGDQNVSKDGRYSISKNDNYGPNYRTI